MQSFITLSGLYTDSIHAKCKSGEKNLQAGNQIREPVSITFIAVFIALKSLKSECPEKSKIARQISKFEKRLNFGY